MYENYGQKNNRLEKNDEYIFSKAKSQQLLDAIKQWGYGKKGEEDKSVKQALDIIDQIILKDCRRYFVVSIGKGAEFYRARPISDKDYGKIEKGFSFSKQSITGFNWKESKEPPAKKAEAGRANAKYEQALYLASNEMTACAEVRPGIRKLVSVARFTLAEDIKIIDFSLRHSKITEKKKQELLKSSPIQHEIDVSFFLAELLFFFTIPKYDQDYSITQQLVKHFRGYGYKGIAYQSFYAEGTNYAFFDTYMKKFLWEDSRVLLHYAVSHLFVPMDLTGKYADLRNPERVKQELSDNLKQELFADTQKKLSKIYSAEENVLINKIYELISREPMIRQKDLAEKIGISKGKIQNLMKCLQLSGYISREGNGKNTRWIIGKSK